MQRLMYGTAWKKDTTADLVFKALKVGFRAIDTAAQPRHYNEALVGAGIQEAINKGVVRREDIFIQTKFTPIGGQDPDNMPYDRHAPLDKQVHASVASSLHNFSFGDPDKAYLDSLVLHSPPSSHFVDLLVVWRALETYVPHRIRLLGISNTNQRMLDKLCTSPDIRVRPRIVQNRFYPETRWEVDMRAYCRDRDIVFQTFWTLSGNPELLDSAPVKTLAEEAGITSQVAMYALVLGLGGTTILDGTKDEAHMKEDLKVDKVLDEYVQTQHGRAIWDACLMGFKHIIGDPLQ
ncbi:putative aldo-keto reductase [Poronia punctata]|nr:putative aldo-keto reductase [Poronia punctata]